MTVRLRRPRRFAELALCVLLAVPVCWAAASVAQAEPQDRAAFRTAWDSYRARFVMADGRVVDDANGGISHSEGQGTAMLIAVGARDDAAFARIWGWTERELYRRPDGLGSWRWEPNAVPHVRDPNNATDGDLLVAWALLRAARAWNNPGYAEAARRIALAVGRHATFEGRFGPMLKPGASGFDVANMADGPVVNLSYWVFPALDALPAVAPEVDWASIAASGLALVDAARFGPADLPTDWISLKGAPMPAKGFPRTFGYDAVRVPLYLAWAGLGTPARVAPFLRLVRDGLTPTVVDVATGLPGEAFRAPGYRAIFTLAACAATAGEPRRIAVASVEPGGPPADGFADDDRYYPSSLHLLARLAAEDRGLACD